MGIAWNEEALVEFGLDDVLGNTPGYNQELRFVCLSVQIQKTQETIDIRAISPTLKLWDMSRCFVMLQSELDIS